MTVHIALLRAINLGPHNKVAMAGLRAMFSDLGLDDAQTVLQTGNVVFRSDAPAAKLERLLEAESQKRFGLETDFMVRTGKEWDAIVAGNPFPKEAKADPAHLVVVVCKEKVGKELKITGVGRELVEPRSREIYVVYPDGIGRSKLKLSARGTARNWNTVLKISAVTHALR